MWPAWARRCGPERATLPTYRAHNEQAMAHAAIAYAKARFRQRMMAVTTSIGPGATNLLTAAALAHVNRLPRAAAAGRHFASRAPDPVLQQLEDFGQGDVSVNDAFRPLTRYFDRITRPEQILHALPRAIAVMTDPATCGPVCLALPQDVQTHAFDCPTSLPASGADPLSPPRPRCARAGPQPQPCCAARAGR
jgi:3D-(3,5/4)-trihydroxycyclohexane-1,2-dione acylhydrolase (decyclizing)